jgi:hypothetical protein
MNPYILIIKQFLIDKHVTEKDVLELLAKNKSKKAPKKLTRNQIEINEIEQELLKRMKKK